MEEEDWGIVCDDCGRFIREGPPEPSTEFPGLSFYIRSLCDDCLPHHECPELEERRREWDDLMRKTLREHANPGQQELDFG